MIMEEVRKITDKLDALASGHRDIVTLFTTMTKERNQAVKQLRLWIILTFILSICTTFIGGYLLFTLFTC